MIGKIDNISGDIHTSYDLVLQSQFEADNAMMLYIFAKDDNELFAEDVKSIEPISIFYEEGRAIGQVFIMYPVDAVVSLYMKIQIADKLITDDGLDKLVQIADDIMEALGFTKDNAFIAEFSGTRGEAQGFDYSHRKDLMY